ncbi:Glyoxalase/bleomycin resistance/extradiol dioxygenase family protein [Rhizobium sp. EC-SD404]|nr:Glyoxalase/bleomycin resistance/extradiol dioxygenase family protein [Rhizobium sp. EC-SD404]
MAGMTKSLPAIPILRSFDEDRTRAFYQGFLDFTVDWEHRFSPDAPLYMQISLGETKLHISEHHGDGVPGSAIFVPIVGLRAYHARITAKNYPNMRPGIVDTPWNTWLMQVTDPSGNKLNFNEYKDA